MADNMTDDVGVISDRVFDILRDGPTMLSLGLSSVWYGDQTIVPDTPSLCVEPGLVRSPLAGVPAMVENHIDVILLLYHSKIGPLVAGTDGGQQAERRSAVQFAYNIRNFLHQNHLQLLNTGGDRITIHSWVTELDPGYAYRNNSMYHAVRMTWQSITKTRLR
jgi:hypothetical protein